MCLHHHTKNLNAKQHPPRRSRGQKGNEMNNTRFNKLWDILRRDGEVKFSDHSESLSLSLVQARYGYEVSLRSGVNTVLVHYDKERFREILVD